MVLAVVAQGVVAAAVEISSNATTTGLLLRSTGIMEKNMETTKGYTKGLYKDNLGCD